MDAKKALGGLTVLMSILTITAIYGIYIFVFSDSPVSNEGLHITGYMWFFSLIIQIPYAVIFLFKVKETTTNFKLVTLIPFVIMWLSFGYGVNHGMPI